MEQLELAGQQIRDYFSNDDEWITIRVERHGEIVPNIYNEREILHMKEVKHLMNKVEYVRSNNRKISNIKRHIRRLR